MELRLLRYFVAVAEERHFGRAATRLHMTQPPLSRAIKQLETDLSVALLHRSATGVELTPAGEVLYAEARTLLEQAEQARARVTAAAGAVTLTVGTLGDSAGEVSTGLAATFRRRYPDVSIRFREADFTDPTTGLRTGLVDVALTRSPFADIGISIRVLRSDPVGVVLRADDPLAGRGALCLADLADRPWFQLPEGTDPVWRAYWNGATPVGERPAGPVVRTVSECMQAVLWNGTVGERRQGVPHPLPSGGDDRLFGSGVCAGSVPRIGDVAGAGNQLARSDRSVAGRQSRGGGRRVARPAAGPVLAGSGAHRGL